MVGLVNAVVVERDHLYVGDVGLEARDTSGGALTRRWASEVNHQCSLKRACGSANTLTGWNID